jgi:biopolymer transport protein ExbD
MNFSPRSLDAEPEVNLNPLIDVLLVILIFLAATTSFTRYQQMELTLPQASAEALDPEALNIAITQEGVFALNGQLLSATAVEDIAAALGTAAAGRKDAVLIINADAKATHEAVVRAMEAARMAGIERVNFATQSPR